MKWLKSPKIAPSPSNTWLLGPTTRHLDRASCFFAADGSSYLYFIMGWPISTPKFPLPMGDLDPHLIHGCCGHPTPHAKRHLDQSSHFATIHLRDQQQTDRPSMNIAEYRSRIPTFGSSLDLIMSKLSVNFNFALNSIECMMLRCLLLYSDNMPNVLWIWDIPKLRLATVLIQLSPIRSEWI